MNKKLQPLQLMFDRVGNKSPEPAVASSRSIDTATKKKLDDKHKNAKVLRKNKRKVAGEVEAAIAMETSDNSINECYDNLLYLLTNIHPGKDEGNSPIIKNKRGLCKENEAPAKKAKKSTDETNKTYSAGGIVVRAYQVDMYSMKDMIKDAEGGGTKILDQITGELIKKMPCGLYPSCASTLDKDGLVIGGELVLPEGHRRQGLSVYICGDHVADKVDDVLTDDDSVGGDRDEELNELETSVMEEELSTFSEIGREGGDEKEEGEEDSDDEDKVKERSFFSQSVLSK